MGASERTDPKAGPLAHFGQAYCNGLDMWLKNAEPMLKGMSRWNSEVMELTARRAQAWMELPSQVSKCKTAQDLTREQLQFWQTAMADYTEGTRRLTLTLGALAGTAVANLREDAAKARDYISFPEGNGAAQDAQQRDRRAA